MVFANRSSLIVLLTSMRPSFIVLKFNIVSNLVGFCGNYRALRRMGPSFVVTPQKEINFTRATWTSLKSELDACCMLHARYLLCFRFNNTAVHQRGIVLYKIPFWGDTHAECIKTRRLRSRKTLPPFSLNRNILMSMRQMVSLEGVKTASYLTPTNAR